MVQVPYCGETLGFDECVCSDLYAAMRYSLISILDAGAFDFDDEIAFLVIAICKDTAPFVIGVMTVGDFPDYNHDVVRIQSIFKSSSPTEVS